MATTLDAPTKLLLALTAFMTVVIGIIVYAVILTPEDPWTQKKNRRQEPIAEVKAEDPLQCDASSLEGSACPAQHFCQFDKCVPVVAEATCKEGESCKSCGCEEGLVCHHFRCADPTRLPRVPLVCKENKALNDAVKALGKKCETRKKSVDDIVSSGTCTVADWEQLALEDEKFDLLLAAFPNRFVVHFPPSRPHLDAKRKDWPTAAVKQYYTEQIRTYFQPLHDAKQIFVIGRASPDGDPKVNHLLALRRMSMVSDMIQTVVHEGIPETQRDQHRLRIRPFALPTQLPDGSEGAKPIDPARYTEVYLTNPPGSPATLLDPVVTWDQANHDRIKRLLDDSNVQKAREGSDWNFLFNAVNRVVLVIPIPCLGDEYEPPIKDQ